MAVVEEEVEEIVLNGKIVLVEWVVVLAFVMVLVAGRGIHKHKMREFVELAKTLEVVVLYCDSFEEIH